jgi:tetratricopeptide (TPR) repeat protein
VPLTSKSIVDVSHESLMRCWDRLIAWADQERAAAEFYVRLSQAAEWHAQGTAGLWRDPELELALRWKHETRPSPGWARRYNDDKFDFDRTIAFLDRSEAERTRERTEREQQRRRKLQLARGIAAVFGVLFLGAGAAAYFAWAENARAEGNLRLARAAVDQSLSSADVDLASAGADVPQMAEFRLALLGKAKQFYEQFLKQNPRGLELRREMAQAHYRLGHIGRMLERPAEAEAEYKQAIAQFEALERERPAPELRQAIANAHNWLGETLRLVAGRGPDASVAYDRALTLQAALVAGDAANATYRQELARTHYNRGILRANAEDFSAASARAVEEDFREAIRLLEPLAASSGTPGAPTAPGAAQELARSYNNLASLVADDESRMAEAGSLYDRAIAVHTRLVQSEPANRQYKLELAKFCNNDAETARVSGDYDRATRRNAQALALLDDLLRPAPSLGIEHADAHNLRGRILLSARSATAESAFQESLTLFDELDRDPVARTLTAFHERYVDLLLNLAALVKESGSAPTRKLLTDAVAHYISHANASLAAGSRADAQLVLDNLTQLLPELPDREKRTVLEPYRQLERRLAEQR